MGHNQGGSSPVWLCDLNVTGAPVGEGQRPPERAVLLVEGVWRHEREPIRNRCSREEHA